MPVREYVERILDDESLTDGLEAAESALLLQHLTHCVEQVCRTAAEDADLDSVIGTLRRTGRKIARVVSTYREEGEIAAKALLQQHTIPWPNLATKDAVTLLQSLLRSQATLPNPVRLSEGTAHG